MRHFLKHACFAGSLLGMLLLSLPFRGAAQQSVLVNLALLDGMELNPDNLFSYQLQSLLQAPVQVQVRGKVVFRGSGLSFSYTFPYTLQPGSNRVDAGSIRPQWNFSSAALRELFMDYRRLPAGTYEYCVEVSEKGPGNETVAGSANKDCLYQKQDEMFLINLVDPENNAKIYEHYPVLSWMVNYPFAAALTYRLRVAEVKKGQNNTAAVNRNNPVFQEGNITQTALTYPVYARQLESYQPYAWTVDAYYKGILLGGAEPWRFTIIEDTSMTAIPSDQSYYEFVQHHGETPVYAIDTLKLKYETYATGDTLQLSITDSKNENVSYRTKAYPLKAGTNYVDLDFPGKARLKHLKHYTLFIGTQGGKKFQVPFIYVNPLYLKK